MSAKLTCTGILHDDGELGRLSSDTVAEAWAMGSDVSARCVIDKELEGASLQWHPHVRVVGGCGYVELVHSTLLRVVVDGYRAVIVLLCLNGLLVSRGAHNHGCIRKIKRVYLYFQGQSG